MCLCLLNFPMCGRGREEWLGAQEHLIIMEQSCLFFLVCTMCIFSFSWFHLFGFLVICFFPSLLTLCVLGWVPLCLCLLEMQAIRREAPSYLVVSIFHNSFMGSQTEGDISPPFKAKMSTPHSVILFCYRSGSVFCFACFYILCTRSCLPFLSTLFTCPSSLPQGFTRTGRSSSYL